MSVCVGSSVVGGGLSSGGGRPVEVEELSSSPPPLLHPWENLPWGHPSPSPNHPQPSFPRHLEQLRISARFPPGPHTASCGPPAGAQHPDPRDLAPGGATAFSEHRGHCPAMHCCQGRSRVIFRGQGPPATTDYDHKRHSDAFSPLQLSTGASQGLPVFP